MRARKIFGVVLVVLTCSLIFSTLFAQEKKYNLNTASDIKGILKEHPGKRVYVRIDSGEEILGIVEKVGDHLVHISGLAGRDFYDAAIRSDQCSDL